jgi:hypothetical protein
VIAAMAPAALAALYVLLTLTGAEVAAATLAVGSIGRRRLRNRAAARTLGLRRRVQEAP